MKRKLDSALRFRLLCELDLTPEEINSMSRHEIFTAILDYEGYEHADKLVKKLVLEVYGIDLDHWEEYLDPESVAEMEGREEY